MKGFIEVTPKVFEPDFNSDNPFDGEYVSKGNIIIGLNSIKLIEGNVIAVNVQGEQIYTVFETYEEMKKLIEKAQS